VILRLTRVDESHACVNYIEKRNIGAISKIRRFVSIDVLMNLYYSLIYPFLTYALVVWGNTSMGNTYALFIDPLFILQKIVR
jgi:hypothetical protein